MSLILCACNCGETLEERDTKGRLRSFIWGHQNRGRSISLPSIRGENHYNWKGGRTVNDAGYILIRMPAHHRANKYGYVREHIVVYENYHKCCILPWIDVHHLDKDKKNNKPENLILITKSEHNKAHAKERSELEYIIQYIWN